MSMREEIAAIAGPMDWTDNRKSWLSRVPERVERLTGTKLSLRIIKAGWNNEITENHWAALELHKAVEVIEYHRELAKVKERHQTLAERLSILDEDFHQPTIASIVHEIRKLRGKDRT
jgi:hypothetical protein